jgi:hypothetical protein
LYINTKTLTRVQEVDSLIFYWFFFFL